ncbi:MAG: sigma-70 family RNA polymerase sigma factor [Prevotella sp.]|nr:sigma-70 family RNA polymerase sigma factor [Prevotella sp.]
MRKRKVVIRVNEKNEVEILSQEGVMGQTLDEKKKGFLFVRKFYFNQLVEKERKNVLLKLGVMFGGLRFEDLEEVYDDGCLVLWGKMMDKDFELREECMVGYLVKVCRNIGMHYLRKVRNDVMSLEWMMENRFGGVDEDVNGLEEMFDILAEKEDEEVKYKKLEKVWKRLKDVDRMILECYYVEGCRMDEIAKRIGYKNGDSVKSKKNRILRKMMSMMKEEANLNDLPLVA